ELAPEEMASPQLGMQMGQAALRTDGKRLSDALPPVLAGQLDTWIQRNAATLGKQGLPPQSLQRFEPWFVGLMVTLAGMADQGLEARLGLDAHMAARAAELQKPTSGLETGAQQIAFLDGMGAAEQLQFLEEALAESAKDGSEVRKLHAAWRAGDADTMWTEMALTMRTRYPALYQRINVARNDAWVPAIEARLARPGSDDTLVVVGALHLLGEDGLVEKLRLRGHAVERICSACKAPAAAATTAD
ncbi:MAG TPA: TraB/GumN family protein, partial [Luteimonas sp.]|nr:TraB/GumN family protein [Luteimonas sp.]